MVWFSAVSRLQRIKWGVTPGLSWIPAQQAMGGIEDTDYHFPSLSVPYLSILEAFTNRMQRVSKPKQSRIFPGIHSNLSKSAYEEKRFKNVSWMWSERDQKVAKQRKGSTLTCGSILCCWDSLLSPCGFWTTFKIRLSLAMVFLEVIVWFWN